MQSGKPKTASIPLMIGVTGHRDLRPQDLPVLHDTVMAQLQELVARYPNSSLVMLNAMSAGADLLCAQCARELGIELVCPLPMPVQESRADIPPQDMQTFDELLEYADDVFVAPCTEDAPHESGREFNYRQASIYIAVHSHVLLALWDGIDSGPDGSGTAQTIDFALHGSFQPSSGRLLHAMGNEVVIHVMAPRGTGSDSDAQAPEAVGTVRWLGDRGNVDEILKRSDEFNALAVDAPEATWPLLPDDAKRDKVLDRLVDCYDAADALSMRSATTYRRVLAALSVFCTAITIAFLLYDEAQLTWMIIVCGVSLVCAWGCSRFARKSDCQRRYVEYRTLAEGLRVQANLRYAGSSLEAAELFTWTQQLETGWITNALSALNVGVAPTQGNNIVQHWIIDQHDYHEKAAVRTRRQLVRNDRIVKIALVVSVLLYIAGLVFEVTYSGLSYSIGIASFDAEPFRTVLKIAMGAAAAGTLFTANYYGKLSLSRVVSDHDKMTRFYSEMAHQFQRFGQTEELLALLAHEELIENGNWCSYQRDNTPDISL